jgi:hypothetical protein
MKVAVQSMHVLGTTPNYGRSGNRGSKENGGSNQLGGAAGIMSVLQPKWAMEVLPSFSQLQLRVNIAH